MRLGLYLYLLLPQTRGAHRVYTGYIAPFLNTHQASIEQAIVEAHDAVKAAGVQYARRAIEWVRGTLLGLPQKEQPVQTKRDEGPGSGYGYNYVQTLLSRWNVPATAAPRGATGAGLGAAGDWSAMLRETVNLGLAMASRGGNSGASPEERVSFLAQQRERVLALMGVLEREEKEARERVGASSAEEEVAHVRRASGDPEVLKKVRSDLDFERVERDEAARGADAPPETAKGWLPWGFGRSASSTSTTTRKQQEGGDQRDATAVSSAVDP